MKHTKLGIIGTVGVPACYGGFESLVDNLLPLPFDTRVYCSSKAYSTQQVTYKQARLTYFPLSANGVSSIPYDILSVLHAAWNGCNKLLILGVSGALILPLVKLIRPNLYIVVNIDGLEWRRQKWGRWAARFLKFSEHLAVRFSDRVIADNAAIAAYVKDEYGVEAVEIAYGGDHAVSIETTEKHEIPAEYAFALCRIEPENNVHLILEACLTSNQPIKFIGNWDNSDYGKELRRRYADHASIELLDPVYDLAQLFSYRAHCKVYLHGHSAGGTNPSLVEMMHFAKPILAYDCNYNRATMNNHGGYFASAEDLSALLSKGEFLAHNSGTALRDIAIEKYTWSGIRQAYLALLNDVNCAPNSPS